MSTITTINSTDLITNSRADINNNFANLNNDKIETSVIDTDTTLAANSDTKIPSQKAVKAYVDAGGNANATTSAKGIVELATQAEVDAGTATGGTGASLVVTPDILSSVVGNRKSVTAGETINGATTPVPVYQDKTDFEFYACDANVNTKYKFIAFAISNGTNGNSMTVQFNGIVPGFTGLTRGEKYYVQDTVGTIGTSLGTMEILVGVAISTTEILIQKGTRRASGTFSIGTATTSEALTLGFRPSTIRFTAKTTQNGTADNFSMVTAVWTSGTLSAIQFSSVATNRGAGGGALLYDQSSPFNNYMTFTVDSVTDTGCNITYTETGTYDQGGVVLWEAEGEL